MFKTLIWVLRDFFFFALFTVKCRARTAAAAVKGIGRESDFV